MRSMVEGASGKGLAPSIYGRYLQPAPAKPVANPSPPSLV